MKCFNRHSLESRIFVTPMPYENTPMQYTAIFHDCENDNFHLIFFFTIFLFLLKTLIVGTR